MENKLPNQVYEELLELRGYLVDNNGQFNPDLEKLEKYWNSPFREWEKHF